MICIFVDDIYVFVQQRKINFRQLHGNTLEFVLYLFSYLVIWETQNEKVLRKILIFLGFDFGLKLRVPDLTS